jgi:hypothetical protein
MDAAKEQAAALRKDLDLYREHPITTALIEKHSVLYLNEKKDDPENTFVHPIITAYAEGEEGAFEKAMRNAEVLDAVMKDSDPEAFAIFKVGTTPFALYPSLASFFDGSKPCVEQLHENATSWGNICNSLKPFARGSDGPRQRRRCAGRLAAAGLCTYNPSPC